jgi:chromosome partitioning protein
MGRGSKMKIITICNQKGGVGKTTTATALARGLTLKGKRTLLIDCDPQGNSSDSYRASTNEGSPTVADLLYSDESAVSCVQHTEFGDILASDPLLSAADKYLTGIGGFYKLKKRLEPLLPQYDTIIIDTPPNLGILLQNALIATEGVIIPVTCGRYALQGMSQLTDTLAEVKSQPNPYLEVLGLLMVKHKAWLSITKEVRKGLPAVADALGTKIFHTAIREAVAVEKAQASRVPIYDFDPSCNPAKDYNSFLSELEKRRII